jgi:hypothetical protein
MRESVRPAPRLLQLYSRAGRSRRPLLITQFEMITSTELSGRGMFSISPFRNSTFSAPALRLFSFAAPASHQSYPGRKLYRWDQLSLPRAARQCPPPDPKSHGLPMVKLRQCCRVAAAKRSKHCRVRNLTLLHFIVEVRSDRIASQSTRSGSSTTRTSTIVDAQCRLPILLLYDFLYRRMLHVSFSPIPVHDIRLAA